MASWISRIIRIATISTANEHGYLPTLFRSWGGNDIFAIGNQASGARQSDGHELAGETHGWVFRPPWNILARYFDNQGRGWDWFQQRNMFRFWKSSPNTRIHINQPANATGQHFYANSAN